VKADVGCADGDVPRHRSGAVSRVLAACCPRCSIATSVALRTSHAAILATSTHTPGVPRTGASRRNVFDIKT